MTKESVNHAQHRETSDVGAVRFDVRARSWYVDLPKSVSGTGQREKIYSIPIPINQKIPGGNSLMTCRTEDMAHYLKRLINDQINLGIFRPERFKRKKPLHLKRYAPDWLEKQTHLGAATFRDYGLYIRKHIIPALGDIFMDDITEGLLEDFQRALAVAPKTKKNIMACLMKMLRDAERHGDISRAPKKPPLTGKDKVIDPEIVWIEPETQSLILDAMRDMHRPIFLFMMLSGCRPSEACALRWSDIKWTRSEIVLAVTFNWRGRLCPVKGKKILPIPMTEGLRYLLESLPQRSSTFVFYNSRIGGPYSAVSLSRTWRIACVKAMGYGIPLYHCTRHSYASQLVNAGVDIAAVQRLMRHTDPRTTKRYYEYKTQPLKTAVEKIRNVHDFRQKRDRDGEKNP